MISSTKIVKELVERYNVEVVISNSTKNIIITFTNDKLLLILPLKLKLSDLVRIEKVLEKYKK